MKLRTQIQFGLAVIAAAATLALGTPAAAQSQGRALSTAQLKAQDKVRVIVAFKTGARDAARAAIAGAGGRVVVDLDELDAVAIEVARSAVPLLQRSPHVEFVELDAERRIQGSVSKRSAADAPSATQVVPYGISMVQADQLPDSMASDRKLCIIDSGIDRSHEDLAGISADGVNLTTSGEWFTDENSHGTHVAGTIAAVSNSVGVVGVMPNKQIRLYIAKVFDATGSASSSVIAQAMTSCLKARANVVSMSLGGSSATRVEQRAATRLASRNILVIAAAGNAGDNTVSYPAGFAEVVSVAAVDQNKAVASFSQFNSDVELSGPGVNVLSTVPAFSQTGASLNVGGVVYPVQGMDGSPLTSATGPLANFGLGDTPVAGSMTGKVCLISRGSIAFSDKVLNCQNSGGVGAVIYNNTSGELLGTLSGVVTTIPSVGALQSDGAIMLGQVGQSTTVAAFATPDLYASYSGTSMATPHVSAVAALVWSYFPTCSASSIRDSLDKSAQDLGGAGRDVNYGFGLVQAKAAYDRISSLGCGN